jgi:hypothetical protein
MGIRLSGIVLLSQNPLCISQFSNTNMHNAHSSTTHVWALCLTATGNIPLPAFHTCRPLFAMVYLSPANTQARAPRNVANEQAVPRATLAVLLQAALRGCRCTQQAFRVPLRSHTHACLPMPSHPAQFLFLETKQCNGQGISRWVRVQLPAGALPLTTIISKGFLERLVKSLGQMEGATQVVDASHSLQSKE